MLSNPPPIFRKRRRPEGRTMVLAPVTPLLLTAATYVDGSGSTLTLVFGRAIELGGVDPARIFVIDNDNAFRTYDAGGGTTRLSATTVRFALRDVGPATGAATVLTALPGNGIAAQDDGAVWAGVSDLVLPFL